LSWSVLTAPAGGQFAPRNIGAIWITNSSGVFVKALARWAAVRATYLTAFNNACKCSMLAADVVSGATAPSHTTHVPDKGPWKCTDSSGAQVPDGDYKIYFEMTDKDGTGPSTSVTFTKGPTAATLTPAGTSNFTNIKLVFTP
jgi:hypothetical protein